MLKAKAKSLADTGRNYSVIRFSVRDNCFHIQGKGVSVNRDYGFAEDLKFDVIGSEIANYLMKVPRYVMSLYPGSVVEYFIAQAVINDNMVHFQVPHFDKFNRDYGISFNISKSTLPSVASFIEKS